MNWLDKTRVDRFAYEMVDPRNLDSSRGFLDHVYSASVTEGYYTDTRISARLEAVDSGYIANSLIRIHHYVDECNYHNELGTFFVDSIEPTLRNGTEVEAFSLTSMLTRISNDVLEKNYAYSGKNYNAILDDMLIQWNVPHEFDVNCPDGLLTVSRVFPCEDGKLSTIFEICDALGARVEVDGHGVVRITKYVNPAIKTPVFTFDTRNGTISSEIKIEEPIYSQANRVIVHFKSSNADVSSWADLPASAPNSYAQTGRYKCDVYSLNELSSPYATNAQLKANQLLADNYDSFKRYTFNSLYVPMKAGDCAELILEDGMHQVMLQTRDIDLCPGMPCNNTFKEVVWTA